MDKLWIRSVPDMRGGILWISEIALIHARKLGGVEEMKRLPCSGAPDPDGSASGHARDW